MSYWQSRNPRERAFLIAVAALALLLMVVAFVWLPLERSRKALRAELPRLEAATATMQRQADEVKRVRALPAAAPAAPTPLATVVASGTIARNLPGTQLTVADERRVRLVAADVPFGALLEAIVAAQAAHGLRVDTARIDALPAAGRVRAELLFTRS